MPTSYRLCAVAVVGVFLVPPAIPVYAGVINLGGGWQAEWDASLDPFVSISSAGVVGDAVFIQKSAEFTQGPEGGQFPSIPIVFRQIAYHAVSNIVIDDEIITNSTGVDWTDFHMQLLDGPDAMFDPALTAASGGPPPIGFSIAPFSEAEFSVDNTSLDIWGGVVPDGNIWFPGNGAEDGQLWINVEAHEQEPFTVFTFKETPTPAGPSDTRSGGPA
ncbi:MAG: hypothetical protein ACYSUQ_13105 [Planctomycetota bacterium]